MRPNILLILVDDMGYGDFGAFGNPAVRTPALDSLFGDGVALTPTWKDGVDLAGLVGQPAQLRFGMRMAKIYAFQVADADPVRVRRSASLPPAATTKEEAGQVDPVSEAK